LECIAKSPTTVAIVSKRLRSSNNEDDLSPQIWSVAVSGRGTAFRGDEAMTVVVYVWLRVKKQPVGSAA
jgi:hypothetical protein